MKKHNATKTVLLIFLFLSTVSAANAASFVIGRIKLPKRSGKTVFLRNAYRKEEVRESFKAAQIDSIIAWHPATPEHVRKFVPSESIGWLWIYVETPQISVGVYSAKGYGIDTNGGIQVIQRNGLIFRSKTAYCLKKTGETDFTPVGKVGGKANNKFRKKVAAYVSDDPAMADIILNSRTQRDKTVLMLMEYKSGE